MYQSNEFFYENSNSLDFTGERFIPGVGDEHIVAEHMQRYNSVLQIVRGKKVLDAACGTGYGSALMASVAREVKGIDISSEAISFAKSRYGKLKNVTYQEASIEKLPFPDDAFDVIVSFETIEHVDEKIQQLFLFEIKRCLKADGILVMSSPDRKNYSDLRQLDNKFHIHEFYYDEYTAFLSNGFKFIRHYFQGEQFFHGELIHSADFPIGTVQFLSSPDYRRDKEMYIISLCSNVESSIVDYDISSFLPYMYVPSILTYVVIDGRYVPHNIIQASSFVKGKNYCAKFDLRDVQIEGRLRFDPLENACCEIEILSISTDIEDYSLEPLNAFKRCGGKYLFVTTDPMIDIIGRFVAASYIEIEYSLRIVNSAEISALVAEKFYSDEKKIQETSNLLQEMVMECDSLHQRLGATTSECDYLHRQMEVITSTREYKILEKLRKLKNILKLS